MHDTRRLHLLRHAKSSWDDPLQSDHDRPLAARGRNAVTLLASHIADHGIHPDLILCSTARRARDTLDGLGIQSETTLLEPRLYSAGPDELLERLRSVDPQARDVMIVGHNPALQMLTLRLVHGRDCEQPASGDLEEIRRKFPTGALATLTFDREWRALRGACAELSAYVRPKALQYS
jgi:phosphohistidine phosphatase